MSAVPSLAADPVVEPTLFQPLLHDLITCVSSPTVVLSGTDGQIRPTGAQGAFTADIRVLSRVELRIEGHRLEPIGSALVGADSAEFMALLRREEAPTPDPTVWLRRRRTARADGMHERLELVNVSDVEVAVTVEVLLAADLLDMETVKAGRSGVCARPAGLQGGLRFSSAELSAVVMVGGAAVEMTEQHAVLRWPVVAAPQAAAIVEWSLTVQDSGAVVRAADPERGFRAPPTTADDRRLVQFVAQSVADLRALRMSTPASPDDEFVAAGSPWYLTLFGRDSIWAARMLLPLGTELAAGTLRALAARQGRVDNPVTAEEPGKILHEIRRPLGDVVDAFLPPVYYGTVDATPLWVCLLADAWRWGMPPKEVEELLPAAERALEWMITDGDSDGDGFLEYVDKSGRGLANQGWKDSGDAIRFADGRIAVGPVALAEVQSYAYEAALAGADLFDAFGRPGGQRWRDYAATLKLLFRERFWATDELGRFPVLALDGEKRQVDAPASNMGHLLASGILSGSEVALVAARLVHPSMSSGFGLRTMSNASGGYSPLSYHCGSVWPHDTAIAIHGLQRAGRSREAAVLAEGLLAASAAFGGRVPELYGGFSMDDLPAPMPYPASCRPQAWSAASAIVLLQAFLGLTADVPAGMLSVAPAVGVGAISTTDLRLAGQGLDIAVSAAGQVLTARTGAAVRIAVTTGPQ